MSSNDWAKHFNRMLEGKLYPGANGTWRLNESNNEKVVKTGIKRRTSRVPNKVKRKARPTVPAKRIKGLKKTKNKQLKKTLRKGQSSQSKRGKPTTSKKNKESRPTAF